MMVQRKRISRYSEKPCLEDIEEKWRLTSRWEEVEHSVHQMVPAHTVTHIQNFAHGEATVCSSLCMRILSMYMKSFDTIN